MPITQVVQKTGPGLEPAVDLANVVVYGLSCPRCAEERTRSVVRSLADTFQHIAVYNSVEGWGYHLSASQAPISEIAPAQFAARLPQAAEPDLLEWSRDDSLIETSDDVLSRRVSLRAVLKAIGLAEPPNDQPDNEHFILCRRPGKGA